jgi:putative transposase
VSRKPRQEEAGALHHVFARGNNRRRIFVDDRDRRRYLLILEHVVAAKAWQCLAYCLMDNHVHLVVGTPRPNLGAGMQLLHGCYAQKHNERHGTSGHVFQGRFGAKRITTDGQVWMTVAYLARNPVDAGLCARPSDWRWSSHSALVRGAVPPWLDVDALLRAFEVAGGDPRRRYLEAINGV